MHIDEGLIQAFRDQEASLEERSRISAHLAGCEACRERLEKAAARAASMTSHFGLLDPESPPPTPGVVTTRLKERIETQLEMTSMWQTAFSRKYRPVWASFLAVTVLVVIFTVPPVRALAAKFLYLFRAQKIETVAVDSDRVQEQMKKFQSASGIEDLIASSVKVESEGKAAEVKSADEASLKAGISVRTPQALGDPVKWIVEPAAKLTMQVDLDRIRGILQEIGRNDIELPETLDGTSVTVDFPPVVVGLYGDCGDPAVLTDPDDASQRAHYRCDVVLRQLMSPTVGAPEGMDVNQVATAMLQVIGFTRAEAEEFAATIDWTTTLVVPVPRNVASEQKVTVDGVPATLIVPASQSSKKFFLMWIKDEILYTLTGAGDKEKALEIANSLK